MWLRVKIIFHKDRLFLATSKIISTWCRLKLQEHFPTRMTTFNVLILEEWMIIFSPWTIVKLTLTLVFFKDFAKIIGTTSFHVKGYLVWSRQNLLEQPSIATIYPNGPNNGVSSTNCFSFLSTKYMITTCRHGNINQKMKLAEPDLVRIR